MSIRNYVDNAAAKTVPAGCNSSTTSIIVNSTASLPTVPFTATLDRSTASAEQVLVTGAVGTTLTVTRNHGGTGAFSHAAGCAFEHTVDAIDLREANTHVNATSGVHGVSGNVVGDTDTQTLANKTLASPAITGTPTLPAGFGFVPTGAVTPYAAAAAPTGWLSCDGSAVSRTTYAGLFAVTGTSYGVGNGSTTFNLPDMTSGKFDRNGTPGVTGGAATHTHTLSDAGKACISVSAGGDYIGVRRVTAGGFTDTDEYNFGGGVASTSGGALQGDFAALAGATDSSSTLPPYMSFTYIIKT